MRLDFEVPVPPSLLSYVDTKFKFGNGRILEDFDAVGTAQGYLALAHAHINEAALGARGGLYVAGSGRDGPHRKYDLSVLVSYLCKFVEQEEKAKPNEPRPAAILAVVTADRQVRDALRRFIQTNQHQPDYVSLATTLLSFSSRYVGNHFAAQASADRFG